MSFRAVSLSFPVRAAARRPAAHPTPVSPGTRRSPPCEPRSPEEPPAAAPGFGPQAAWRSDSTRQHRRSRADGPSSPHGSPPCSGPSRGGTVPSATPSKASSHVCGRPWKGSLGYTLVAPQSAPRTISTPPGKPGGPFASVRFCSGGSADTPPAAEPRIPEEAEPRPRMPSTCCSAIMRTPDRANVGPGQARRNGSSVPAKPGRSGFG